MLGGRRLRPQRGGVSEACPERPRHLSGVSETRMVGFRAAAKRHCLGGFGRGGLGVGELRRIDLVDFGDKRR